MGWLEEMVLIGPKYAKGTLVAKRRTKLNQLYKS